MFLAKNYNDACDFITVIVSCVQNTAGFILPHPWTHCITSALLHCTLSLAAQCIVIGPVCGCVCVCVGLLPR